MKELFKQTNEFKKAIDMIADDFLNNKRTEYTNDDFTSEIEKSIIDVIFCFLREDSNIDDGTIAVITKNVPDDLRKIVAERLKAMKLVKNNQVSKALNHLAFALEISKESTVPKWIVRDILLDIRNTKATEDARKNIIRHMAKEQQELQDMKDDNHFPTVNKYVTSAMMEMNEEMYECYTVGNRTIRYSSKMQNALKDLLRAMAAAILYGSISFTHIIRRHIALLIYNTSKIHGETNYVLIALRLFIMDGDVKRVSTILDREWNSLYPNVVSLINELVVSDVDRESSRQITMKCALLSSLGPYVMESYLPIAREYLFKHASGPFSMDTNTDVRRSAVRGFSAIINRTDNDPTIQKLTDLIGDIPLVNDEIARTMRIVDWGKVEDTTVKVVVSKLENLLKEDKVHRKSDVLKVFSDIHDSHEGVINHLLEGYFKKWTETKHLDIAWFLSWIPAKQEMADEIGRYLIDSITSANRISSSKKQMISVGGISKYYTLAYVLQKASAEVIERAADTYAATICNPKQAIQYKYEAIKSMNLIIDRDPSRLGLVKAAYSKVVESRSSSLQGVRSHIGIDDNLEQLDMSIDQMAISLGLESDSRSILMKCIVHSNNSRREIREEAISVVNVMCEKEMEGVEEALQMLYLRTYDDWHRIQGDAILLFSKIATERDWISLCKERLNRLLKNASPYVRRSAIDAVIEMRKRDTIDKKDAERVLAPVTRDYHYKIAICATKAMKVIQTDKGEGS